MKKIVFNYLSIIFFATVFSILYQGYYFGENNGSFYIPYLKSLHDNSLYQNDLLISTWKEVYFANLWKFLAIVINIIPIEHLLLAFHVVFRFIFFLVVYLLSLHIFKHKKVAYLSVILWFIPKPSLGFEILYNEFVQSEVALVILLFSILLFLKNKYIISFIILGLAFHIHPPMAGFTLAGFLLYLVYKRNLKNIIKLMITVFILAFSLIIRILLLIQSEGGYDVEWIQLTRVRSPHHSFPLSWPTEAWIPFFLFFCLFLAGIYNVWKKIARQIMYKIFILLISFLVIMLGGFFFTEVIPIPKIIIAVPFHISSIFTILASLFIAYWIYSLMIRNAFKSVIIGYTLFIFTFFNNFDLQLHRAEMIIVSVSALGILLVYKSKIFQVEKSDRRQILPVTIFLLSIVIFWMPFMINKNFTRSDPFGISWIDVQKWSKTHTDKDAVFIVPIYLQGFRVYSERSIVGDWKDGSGGYLSPKFIKQWWHRMEDFGLDKTHHDDSYQKNAYRNLSREKIVSLGKRYNVDYFVTEKKSLYFFPMVYSNNYFVVYKLSYINDQ